MDHPENEPMRYRRGLPARTGEFEPPPPSAQGQVEAFGTDALVVLGGAGIGEVLDDFGPTSCTCTTSTTSSRRRSCGRSRRHGVPAVMTLHDYKLVCPTYRLLDHGKLCDACVPRRLWQPRRPPLPGTGPLAASAAAAVELSVHTLTGAYGHVARFICPSRFMADR